MPTRTAPAALAAPRRVGTRPEPTLRSHYAGPRHRIRPDPEQRVPTSARSAGRSLLAALVGCMTLVPALLAVTPGTASAATYPDNVAQPVNFGDAGVLRACRRADPERATGGHGLDARRRRVLDRGLRRWHLQLRRRPLPGVGRCHPAQQADRRHGRHARRRRVLARRLRRRHLLLRRCPFLRFHRLDASEPAHRRHGHHA